VLKSWFFKIVTIIVHVLHYFKIFEILSQSSLAEGITWLEVSKDGGESASCPIANCTLANALKVRKIRENFRGLLQCQA
jgi:hypothetical protein